MTVKPSVAVNGIWFSEIEKAAFRPGDVFAIFYDCPRCWVRFSTSIPFSVPQDAKYSYKPNLKAEAILEIRHRFVEHFKEIHPNDLVELLVD